MILAGLAGCESASSVTATKTEAEAHSDSEAVAEVPSELAQEAAEKYVLASKLLEFAGPIDDLSYESNNVRLLGADLLQTAIELDPTQFKYYRDLFMTYMVLQEPVKALEVLEPASKTPGLADEVAEFRILVFGAVEFVSSIDQES